MTSMVNVIGNKSRVHLGWVAAQALRSHSAATGAARSNTTISISARAITDLGDVPLPDVAVDPKIHTVKVGLNYRLWDAPPWVTGAATAARAA